MTQTHPDPVRQSDVGAEPLRAEVVDQPPGDRGAGERDRHRHEDQRLGDRLAAPQTIDQGGEREPDAHGHHRHDQRPPQRVADRAQHALVGEHELEVVQPDEAFALSVLEADQERVDHGVDEEDAEDDERRPDEDVGTDALPVPLGEEVHDAVHRPVQEEDPADAHHDRHAHDEEPVGVGVAQEVERRP